MLHCASSQYMWVSWENNIIKAGQGKQVGLGPFIEWSAGKEVIVNAVGISSAVNLDGLFMFGNLEG